MARKLPELPAWLWALVALGALTVVGALLIPFVGTTCVVEGTPIDTPEGLVLVEAAGPGQVVWTVGPDGTREPGRVTAVHPGKSRAWLELVLEDGTRLQATTRHPIRAAGDWIEAGLLSPGDLVLTRDGPRAVSSVLRREGHARVFDLEVEPNPNFFAAGVLVHNKSRNDRNAGHSLKTIFSAQVDFRANDRDGDGVGDFWVGDVSGLYTIVGSDGDGLKLIERSIARADGNPRPNWGGTKTIPLDPFEPKAGYVFRALTFYEDKTGRGIPYDNGKGRHPSKFGFIAAPAPGTPYPAPTLIIDENGRVYAKDLGVLTVDRFPREPEAQGWKDWDSYRR